MTAMWLAVAVAAALVVAWSITVLLRSPRPRGYRGGLIGAEMNPPSDIPSGALRDPGTES